MPIVGGSAACRLAKRTTPGGQAHQTNTNAVQFYQHWDGLVSCHVKTSTLVAWIVGKRLVQRVDHDAFIAKQWGGILASLNR